MSTVKYRKKLLALQHQRTLLFKKLLDVRPILRGTVNRVSTRCGKPNCWCADSPEGHPHLRMTWSHEGKMFTRKVPHADLPRIRNVTENYRRFRSLRRRLVKLQEQIKQTLDRYETALVNESRARMPFLNVGVKNAAQQTKRVHKTRNAPESNKS